MTHQLTIRFDEDLAREIEDVARRERVSRNQAVLRLLRKGVGLDEPPVEKEVIGTSLDWFIGSWTEEEAREFDEAVADFETIDEELWK
ncbi:MAG TPA: hypothetical protein VNA04_15185 [Thermoanaerobaculia bacterium]|nr:hypothetical protein [Thermoanaerobaculia bacterium]